MFFRFGLVYSVARNASLSEIISALARESTKSAKAVRVSALWRLCGAVLISHLRAYASCSGCDCQKAALICFCDVILFFGFKSYAGIEPAFWFSDLG